MPRLIPWLSASRPTPEVVRAGFRQTRYLRLRLDRFPRGIDHLHIDVALGPALGKAVSSFVGALVRENAQRLWNQAEPSFSKAIAEGFAQVLEDHHRVAVKEARAESRPERVQLFQLALLKLLFNRIDKEIAGLRSELEDARSLPARQLSGQSLQLHEQAVALGKRAAHLRFRVARQVMREVMQLEGGVLKNLRKSVLGVAWPVAETLLGNPVLQLDGVGTPGEFARLYPIVLHDSDAMRRASDCVLDTLSSWLPPGVGGDTGKARPALATRADQGHARGFLETEQRVHALFGASERDDWSASWLDVPENATALLGGAEAEWPRPGPWFHPGMARLQRKLNRRLAKRLGQVGLLRRVIASYALSTVYPALGVTDGEGVVFDYLSGRLSRRDTLRRLASVEGARDPQALLRRIDELHRDFRAGGAAARPQLIARFAADCLRLRRDLLLGWRTFAAMDSIRLISDERDAALSRANNVLQLFCRADTAFDTRSDIIGHVILAVEVRGTTELAWQMRRRNLGASGHFSRFLFDPCTRAIQQFAAHKVTVRDDLLMLSIVEHGSANAEHLAVARACALAAKILEQGDAMNVENRRLGLPEIELGLGIAYVDEAPIHLYDHARKVTVSPAIARARRLAACDGVLRENCERSVGRGLCVAAPLQTDDRADEDERLRYNVNSIELDAVAFARLHVEISLHTLGMWDKRRKRQVVVYGGTCADINGEGHWLVVRERIVKLLAGRKLIEKPDEHRHYYEVVVDPRLIARVRDRLAAKEHPVTQTAPAVRQFD